MSKSKHHKRPRLPFADEVESVEWMIDSTCVELTEHDEGDGLFPPMLFMVGATGVREVVHLIDLATEVAEPTIMGLLREAGTVIAKRNPRWAGVVLEGDVGGSIDDPDPIRLLVFADLDRSGNGEVRFSKLLRGANGSISRHQVHSQPISEAGGPIPMVLNTGFVCAGAFSQGRAPASPDGRRSRAVEL